MTMTRPDVSQIIGVASGGLRNRIINGAMLVNQRNAASLSSGISSVTYGLDRFYVFAVGAAVTIDRIAGVGYSPNNTSALRVTGAAGNTNVSIGQRIEAANIRELAGSTVAVSFWVYQTTGSAKQVGATIYAPTATDNWTSQTTIGTFSTLVQHATWTRVEGTIPLTSAIQYGASLGIEFLGLLASQQLAVTQVQVEPGTVATTFEQRPIGLELALCQRYYESRNILTSTTSANIAQGSWAAYKRVVPTITLSIGVGSGAVVSALGVEGWYQSANNSNNSASILTASSEL